MAVECDYYDLLGVARSADVDAINAAIKKVTREWRKRTESSDLGSRQEAETTLKRAQDARTTLLDPSRRQAYDARLDREGVAKPEAASSDGDWLDQATAYLARGDYHSAAYAAREATHTSRNSPESWWIRSRASSGLGRLDDALYEAKQAVSQDTSNGEYHFHLGCVAEEMKNWSLALNEFQTASRLDASAPMYELAVGGVYLQNGMPSKALPIVERVHRANPNDQNATYYYTAVLVDLAEEVPRVRSGDGYVVTTAEEVTRMRELVRRASAVKKVPPEVRTDISQITGYLDRMEARKLSPPITALIPSSCGGVLLFAIFMLSPIWLAIAGIAAMSDGHGGGFLALLLGIGLGIVFFKLSWVPNWKVNARMYR